jgi:hypothetical protein
VEGDGERMTVATVEVGERARRGEDEDDPSLGIIGGGRGDQGSEGEGEWMTVATVIAGEGEQTSVLTIGVGEGILAGSIRFAQATACLASAWVGQWH